MRLGIMLVLMASLLSTAAGSTAGAKGRSGLESGCFSDPKVEVRGECVQDLRTAREATEFYQDFRRALADGFVPLSECVHEEHGAMGIHFLNLDRYENNRVEDPIDISKPEILLYVPDRATGLRLVGVEWAVNVYLDGENEPYRGITPPPSDKINPPPELFGGREFDGPMAGHNPAQPWHYDLHVWAWSENSDGLFAHYNPSEDCLP
jgi:hypothetical protein